MSIEAVAIIVLFIGGIYLLEFITNHAVRIPKERIKHLRRLNRLIKKYNGFPQEPVPRLVSNEEFLEAVRARERAILVAAGSKVMTKHIEVLLRKRKQLVYEDDYGRKMRREWEQEIAYFVRNILLPELQELVTTHKLDGPTALSMVDDREGNIDFWAPVVAERVEGMLASRAQESLTETNPFVEYMSGHDYEHYVADLIRGHGWNALVTPGSGDQGADIIAVKNGYRLAVQCKLYSTPVGNKSVQEAFTAQGFYDCKSSCVVTNNTYTPAARKAAYKLDVKLLHHEDIGGYLSSLA